MDIDVEFLTMDITWMLNRAKVRPGPRNISSMDFLLFLSYPSPQSCAKKSLIWRHLITPMMNVMLSSRINLMRTLSFWCFFEESLWGVELPALSVAASFVASHHTLEACKILLPVSECSTPAYFSCSHRTLCNDVWTRTRLGVKFGGWWNDELALMLECNLCKLLCLFNSRRLPHSDLKWAMTPSTPSSQPRLTKENFNHYRSQNSRI